MLRSVEWRDDLSRARDPRITIEYRGQLALFEPVDRYGAEPGLVFPIYVSLSAWCSEAYAALGDFPQAFASAREALRIATDIHHPTSLAVANRYLGYVHILRGEMDTAVPFLERGFAIARESTICFSRPSSPPPSSPTPSSGSASTSEAWSISRARPRDRPGQ